MKKILLFVVFSTNILFAQLNCKTITTNEGTETKCFHLNKAVSTIEKWDANKYWGTLKAFDKTGKEIFSYGLRRVAGHSSVYLSYHKNGQVSKAEYSSQPDGGIQRYHEIRKFDENGNQTEFIDDSWPDGYPRLVTQPHKFEKPIVDSTYFKQEVIQCAVPYFTFYKVKNTTNKKVAIKFVFERNASYFTKRTHERMVLEPKQLFADSAMMAQMYLKQTDAYRIEIHENQPTKSNFRVIFENPKEPINNKKEYIWYIVED
jgi:hypothetical protein